MDNIKCLDPFYNIIIGENGDCLFCCRANYFIGNIFEQSFEEIWYGKQATEFRKSILEKNFKYCDMSRCPSLGNYTFDVNNLGYPKMVLLNYNRACNCRCVMCRDKLIVEDEKNLDFHKKFTDKIVEICKNAEIVYLNGVGELFVSKHFQNLINILIETYPSIKFDISTNGVLCNEATLQKFNMLDRLHNVYFSVHAATKDTYEKIVRGGIFDEVVKNAKFIGFLKSVGMVNIFNFSFVISSLNYQEMPKFVNLAKEVNALPNFWRLGDFWDSDMCKNYKDYAVWDKDHKDYKKFLNVLKKLKNINGYKIEEPFLRALQANQHDTWLDKVKKVFKFN